VGITLSDARKIIDVGIAKAEAMGVKVTIAVINQEGRLISLSRMDGAGYLTPDIAIGKANAAAAFRRSSAEVQISAEKRTAFYSGISTLAHGEFLAGMGAIIVRREGQLIGAIGVSGAKPEEDVLIAETGLNSL
jgi:uncharacterized protein GlcG (DUF336 family)